MGALGGVLGHRRAVADASRRRGARGRAGSGGRSRPPCGRPGYRPRRQAYDATRAVREASADARRRTPESPTRRPSPPARPHPALHPRASRAPFTRARPDGAHACVFLRSPAGDRRGRPAVVARRRDGDGALLADPRALLGGDDARTLSARGAGPPRAAARGRARASSATPPTRPSTLAAFALSGRLWRRRPARRRRPASCPAAGPVIDPRPSPDGQPGRVRRRRRAARRATPTASGDRALAEPGAEPTSPGGWPSSSRPRRWTATAASGGRRTADRAARRAGRRVAGRSAGTSPTRRTPRREPRRVALPGRRHRQRRVTLWHVLGLDGTPHRGRLGPRRVTRISADVHWTDAAALR